MERPVIPWPRVRIAERHHALLDRVLFVRPQLVVDHNSAHDALRRRTGLTLTRSLWAWLLTRSLPRCFKLAIAINRFHSVPRVAGVCRPNYVGCVPSRKDNSHPGLDVDLAGYFARGVYWIWFYRVCFPRSGLCIQGLRLRIRAIVQDGRILPIDPIASD